MTALRRSVLWFSCVVVSVRPTLRPSVFHTLALRVSCFMKNITETHIHQFTLPHCSKVFFSLLGSWTEKILLYLVLWNFVIKVLLLLVKRKWAFLCRVEHILLFHLWQPSPRKALSCHPMIDCVVVSTFGSFRRQYTSRRAEWRPIHVLTLHFYVPFHAMSALGECNWRENFTIKNVFSLSIKFQTNRFFTLILIESITSYTSRRQHNFEPIVIGLHDFEPVMTD